MSSFPESGTYKLDFGGRDLIVCWRVAESKERIFDNGRLAALEALKASGFTETWELKRPGSRLPVWPSGFTGSISHTAKGERPVAVAVVSADGGNYLGLDIEPLNRLISDNARARICSQSEKEWIAGVPFLTFDSIALEDGKRCEVAVDSCIAIHCAKETLFKAFSKSVPDYLIYKDIALSPDAEGGTLEINRFSVEKFKLLPIDRCKVHFYLLGDLIVAIAATMDSQ